MNVNGESIKHLLSGSGEKIPLFKVFMPESVVERLKETLLCGYIGEGPRVDEFERLLAARIQSNNALAVNNGTSAIQLALRLAGVQQGDDIISTPMTCAATNMPVLAMGANIVWADIDPWTGEIDPADVLRKITARTKAVICVHWGGYPCDLDALRHIAEEHGISLIEDACHAIGSTYRDRPVGSHSDFVCFSFQAIKMITTVDGGALVCKASAAHDRGRRLRWFGIDRQTACIDLRCAGDIAEYGYKFHMNDVTATIGIEQLHYLDYNLEAHRENARSYDAAFRNLRCLQPLRYSPERTSAYWLYTLRVKGRDAFMGYMHKAGITVSQVHVRNDLYTAFRNYKSNLPGVDEFTSEQISIPVGWWLTQRDIEHIIAVVSRWSQ